MDTGIIVIILFLFGLASFLVYLKASDAKESGGSVLEAVADFFFLAWILGSEKD